MEEKKDNRGGVRVGAGRKRKDEEQDVINLLDKHINRDTVVLKLLEKIKQGDGKMISLYFQYVYGKPIATINQSTTLTVNDVDISELITFKKPDSDNE
jgi:hypothetical protein